MPAPPASESRLRAAVSVSQMAAMVGLSRARFYELVERGVFLPPVYCLATKRPLYLRVMQQRNLEVRREQVGVNGAYVLFYQPRERSASHSRGTRSAPRPRHPHHELARRLLPQLQSLGLGGVSADAVAHAIGDCFPEGTSSTAEPEVLRAVYRRLRRQQDA